MLILALSGLTPSVVDANECIDYERYLHVIATLDTGIALRVYSKDNLVFVVDDDDHVRIVDLSSPSSPQWVGTLPYLRPPSIAFLDDLVLVVQDWGLHVVDISDIENPVVVGHISIPGGVDIAVEGVYAYLARGSLGLSILDMSNPSEPQVLGSLDTPGTARAVCISGDRAYLADGSVGGLSVIDVSNRQNPFTIGSVDTPGSCEDVVLRGAYAYVADGLSHGVRVIDIAQPTSPEIIARVVVPALRVEVAETSLYVAGSYSGVHVINIENPIRAQLSGSIDLPEETLGVAVSGSSLCVATYYAGLSVIASENNASPPILETLRIPNGASGIAVSGNNAFVAASSWGLCCVQIRDPNGPLIGGPRIIGSVETPGQARRLAVAGDYAYLADGYVGGLQVIEVSQPEKPQIVGSLNTTGWCRDIDVSNGFAYVVEGSAAVLRVIDISEPSAPRLTSFISGSGWGWAQGLDVSGEYAFVATSAAGLQIVDVTDPSAPMIIGGVMIPGEAEDVLVSGELAYVVDGYAGAVHVVDVTNLAQPQIIGSVETPTLATSLAISGAHAYVADTYCGLQVIDVENPHSPGIVGCLDTPGFPRDVATTERFLLLADGIAGLHFLPRQCPSKTAVSQSKTDQVQELFVIPNPVRSGVNIHGGSVFQGTFRAGIYDIAGRLVRIIHEGISANSLTSIQWDGCDSQGVPAAAGTYIVRVSTSNGVLSERLTVIR
jgi:hypothetical protein